ncbi:kinesin-like protein KIN-10C isoform X2 [Glycine max]|uniref:kinesin-like protein KIN-10C isoform X2 n=1 Tax=Glycine max TaxID=3847 RepID=UPI001B3558E4|nr:kinesin-like protein KIN-10C isoform X2 [Glycine max]
MDLLNLEKPPILVFEDRGRIQFKGLSQGAPKKGGCEHVRRSHMGLIVHIFSQNGSLVSKVNFVDLAGYEDARKKSSDGSYLAEIKNYTHATGFVEGN